MTHWIKRLLAAGATALALGSVTMAVSSPAFAKDEAKPAVTAPATAAGSPPPATAPNKMILSLAMPFCASKRSTPR